MPLHEHITSMQIHDIIIFGGAAVLGMLFAYYRKWSWDNIDEPLIDYLLGDKHATGRAITTLVVACGAAGGLDYLNALTDVQIFVAGAGIGLMVPSSIEAKINNKG